MVDDLHDQVGSERIRDPRLWHAPVAFCRSIRIHGRPCDQRDAHPLVRRSAWRGTSVRRRPGHARGGGSSIAARRQWARFSPLFFGRADADLRSERQRRHRRPHSGSHAGRRLPSRSRGDGLRNRPHFDTDAEAGVPPSSIVAVGGGLRNPIWTQATSDISGLKQEAREVSVGASYWRRLSGEARYRRRLEIGYPSVGHGRTHILVLIPATSAFTKGATQRFASSICVSAI